MLIENLNNKLVLVVFVLHLLANLFATAASAEPVTTIGNNGDSTNRVDIVILGDGYTSGQLSTYAAHVETFVRGIFAQEPYKEYQRYFNVHRIDVTSNESGADHPERNPPIFRDTALDAFYKCDPNASDARLICVNLSKVNDVLFRSLPAEKRDIVLVVVNDTEYGGSGGAVAVASVHPDAVEIILHELGHSFGLLADEYGGSSSPVCNSSIEPPEVNVTKETVREQIKWNYWISAATPVPTLSTKPGIPGLYEGAKYCDTGLFRPTFDSKMRSLFRPFEQINSEQLVKRIYNWVSPIDSTEPLLANINLTHGATQLFSVEVPRPLTQSLQLSWKLDDQAIGTGEEFLLNSSQLTVGSHKVEVVVIDPTAFVRDDPDNLLSEVGTWTIIVNADTTGPDTIITASSSVLSNSSTAAFSFVSDQAGGTFACSLDGGPFVPCRSPKKYSRLANGNHTFQVKATNSSGQSDPTPASHLWTVDTLRPDTTITSAPPLLTNNSNPRFEFTASDGGTTFQCKLDAAAFEPCTTPKLYSGLALGKHIFQVVAMDSAGNSDKKPARHKWTIDTAAPQTAIKTKTPAVTNNQFATFRFSATERQSTFECSLDGSSFSACTSPQTFSNLDVGGHTFQVRATDPAGNVDSTPAIFSWNIQ